MHQPCGEGAHFNGVAHAVSRFENTDGVAECLKSVVVKIIELQRSKKKVWQESDFWKGLLAEGISISFLSSPCVLEAKEPNSAGCHHITQSEVKHVFTEQFWPKVLAEPVTGAIIMSRLRALNEALHQLNQRDGIIIILEGDTTPCQLLGQHIGQPTSQRHRIHRSHVFRMACRVCGQSAPSCQ